MSNASEKYPVKLPVVLAVLVSFVAPVLAVLYAGLLEMDFSGWLEIFSPLKTSLDLIQAVLFLGFLGGNVHLLWKLRRYMDCAPADRYALDVFLKIFTGVVVALLPVTLLYSVFAENPWICFFWVLLLCLELVLGVCLGAIVLGMSKRLGNRWLFVIGIALIGAHAFDYSGFRTVETFLVHVFPGGEESVRSSEIAYTLWGLSAVEYGTLDEDTQSDLEEVSQFALYALWALAMLLVVIHSGSLVLFYVLLAVLFAQKNKAVSSPGELPENTVI